MRYHVKNVVTPHQGFSQWAYDEQTIPLYATNMLLVRIVVGKVADKKRVETATRSVPVIQGGHEWNCLIWVKEALKKIDADGKAVGTSKLDWQTVRDGAMGYVQEKKTRHRFDGQGSFDMKKAATFDLLEGRELID